MVKSCSLFLRFRNDRNWIIAEWMLLSVATFIYDFSITVHLPLLGEWFIFKLEVIGLLHTKHCL